MKVNALQTIVLNLEIERQNGPTQLVLLDDAHRPGMAHNHENNKICNHFIVTTLVLD